MEEDSWWLGSYEEKKVVSLPQQYAASGLQGWKGFYGGYKDKWYPEQGSLAAGQYVKLSNLLGSHL